MSSVIICTTTSTSVLPPSFFLPLCLYYLDHTKYKIGLSAAQNLCENMSDRKVGLITQVCKCRQGCLKLNCKNMNVLCQRFS